MFILQKIIGILISPLSILILCSLVAANRMKKKNSVIIYLCLLFFYLISIDPIKQIFVYPLESYSYEKENLGPNLDQVNAIVVLGGGVTYHGVWDRPRLSLDALARTYKAKQVYDALNGDVPIISSSGLPKPEQGIPAEGVIIASVLENMQVFDAVIENASRNTFENALLTRKMLEAKGEWFEPYPIILVSSALHLPRAIACFEKQGFKVIPSASHYLGSSEFVISYSSFLPLPTNISHISQAVHEYVGLLYYGAMGRI